MKKIKVTVTAEYFLPEGGTIAAAPDGEPRCIKIGDDFYQPAVHWIKYVPHGNAASGIPGEHWTSGSAGGEEIVDGMVSLDYRIDDLSPSLS